MNRLEGRTALITGASAGIGRACAVALAERGVRLVLFARRLERLEELAAELRAGGTRVEVRGVDVRDAAAVDRTVTELEAGGTAIDILVNNAGLARGLSTLQEGRIEDWDTMIDTNVKGVLACIRAVVPHMVERDRGHVIQIGSIAGQQVYRRGNVYNATKFAVRALNHGLNLDLLGTRVRVSSIDPGLVETEFSEVRFRDSERAATVYQGYTPLRPEDVAEAVCWVANAPPHVDVLEMLILPTDQRSVGAVHRTGE